MSENILYIRSRQIKSLQCMLLSQLKNSLIKVKNSLKKIKRSNAKQQLRNYLQHLPVTIRSELLNMVLCPYRRFGGISYRFTTDEDSFDTCLLFLKALLSPGMDCIYINFPEEENFIKILQCLLQNASKLKILCLPLPSDIYSLNQTKYYGLLLELLVKNGSWLTNLQLGSGCNNRLMQIIGENCHFLQNLDIEESPVSDEGIQVLTQISECREGRGFVNDEEAIDESLIISQRVTRSITKPCIQKRKHICRYMCYKTNLCHSLRRINLLYTKATEKGIYALLSIVSNLEDIGMSMVKVLDNLYKSYEEDPETFQCPNWNLRSLYIPHLLPRHLTMLSKLTTNKGIKNLIGVTTNINHDFEIMQCYGSNLTNLDLRSIQWASNVSSFLKHCPNLISLNLHAYKLTWSDDQKPVPSPTLQFARLSWKISCESAILFMESATGLKEVYFSRVEEDEKFLSTLCEKCISKELKVLYLSKSNFKNNPGLVSEFWQCHRHTEFIGRIAFDLTELQLGSAVNLKLINIASANLQYVFS